jgi:hypothetical protein
VRQYDQGLGHTRQGVISLEPVYGDAGGDATWVNWFFKEFVNGAAMEFAYTQAGQENSFTWDAMSKGYEIQMPLIAQLRNEKKLKVETLAASGQWFKDHYKVTPATAVTITEDIKDSDKKTVWFNSRFYRVNLLWESNTLRIRDIHLFNEQLPSIYETQKATSNECSFFALPFVDGYLWSDRSNLAGLRLKAIKDGKEILIEGGDPVVTDAVKGKLHISWPLKSFKGTIIIDIDEKELQMKMTGDQSVKWFLDLTTTGQAKLPFVKVAAHQVDCEFEAMKYSIYAKKGTFSKPDDVTIFRITPEGNAVSLNFLPQ